MSAMSAIVMSRRRLFLTLACVVVLVLAGMVTDAEMSESLTGLSIAPTKVRGRAHGQTSKPHVRSRQTHNGAIEPIS